MARNGSGTFSRTAGGFAGSSTWQNQRDVTANIYASNHDEHDQDIADAITASLAKDGQTVPTANLPMGTYRHTGVGAPSARDQYATVAGLQDGSYIFCGTSTGSSNAYAVSAPIAVTTPVTGTRLAFYANHQNNGGSTLVVNGGGTYPIRGSDSSVLATPGGLFAVGSIVEVMFDAVNSYWRLIRPNLNGWRSWTPSVSADDSMTIGSITVSRAVYAPGESETAFELMISGTLGGTPSDAINITLPSTVAGGDVIPDFAEILQATNIVGKVFPMPTTNTLKVFQLDESNYAAGSVRIRCRGRYIPA